MDQGRVAGAAEHEGDGGDEVEAGQDRRQAFVVASEAAAARHPGEAALDHP